MTIENEISIVDFAKVKMSTGTIVEAKVNQKAIKPAYVLTIDFGKHGIKTSSAQIAENYKCEDLVGIQVIAIMNFPTKRIAGIKSEVLVLAAVDDKSGTVLLSPTKRVTNGTAIL